MSLIKFQLVN